MKILICSDTHGRIEAAKALVGAIEREKPDQIFHLGDYLYNGPRNGVPEDYQPMEVCEIFNRYADQLIGVEGNCDSRIDHTLLHFEFPCKRELDVNGHHLILVHGDFLPDPSIVLKKGDILLSGHTHLYLLEKEGEGLHLNPGSIGFPKGGNPRSYAILDEKGIAIKRLEDGEILKSITF